MLLELFVRLLRLSCPLALPTILALMSVSTGQSQDWPQWRGPNRDGVLESEVELVQSLPKGNLPRLWAVPLEAGYSGPTVAEGLVYVTDRVSKSERDSRERIHCFDAATGQRRWVHEYDAAYTIQYTAGPRASVTIDRGHAYAVGAMGHFHCLDALTGELIWKHELESEYEIRMPIWGIAAAPLVYQELVIQIVSGANQACIVAFDRNTGREVWRSLDEPIGYSAPIIVRQGDSDVVVCWTGASVAGLDPASGKTHWRIEMPSRNMPIGVATPVMQGKHLFVSSFYDGSMLIELDSQRPMATQLWRRIGQDEQNTDALHCMIGTPLIKGDYIYGVDSYGELRCLKLDSGDRVWEDQTAVPRNRWATIHIIQSGEREIMLNEQGDLIFATLSPDGYHEHSRSHLIDPTKKQLPRRNGVTWSHPAIADGVIYARSDKELVAASLKSL
jgi:outer membrane protein assembly factor BamB